MVLDGAPLLVVGLLQKGIQITHHNHYYKRG